MSRGRAAASSALSLDDSGALESALEGADDIVVVDGESQPAEKPDDELDGDEEDGTPASTGADAEPEDEDEQADDDASELKRKLAVERRAKKALEKRLQQIERRQQAVEQGTSQHLRAVRDQNVDGQLGQARSRVAALENHVKAAQQARREALDSGDTDRIMQSDEQWFAARSALDQARSNAALAERQAAAIKQRPIQVSDPGSDAQVQAEERDKRARDWVARNRWFGEDPNSRDSRVARAESRRLAADGFPPSEDEHWEILTQNLRPKLPHRFANQPADGKTRKNGAPPMATASQRGGASGARREVDKMSPDSKAISRAEVEAWKIGRNMDIVNNPDHRKEFLSQRARSRSSRGELFNG